MKSGPPRPEVASGSADDLARRAEAQYQLGDADGAAQLLDEALAIDRRHARANWVLGNIAQDRGNLDRAITCYRRALRADAALAEAQNDLGTAYFAKGWPLEAEQCYREALKLRPDHFAAAENLAAAMRAQGKLREARDAFVLALKLRLAGAFNRLFRRAPRQVSPAEGGTEAVSDEAEALLQRGNALAANGDRAGAIESFERAAMLRSSVPKHWISLGDALTDDRQHGKAIEAYQRALMLDPGDGIATGNIARVLHMLGYYREAEEVHRSTLEKDPDIAGAHSNLASTLLSLGRYAEAEAAARKALELREGSIHAAAMLANALLEQGRLADAQAAVRKAATSDPMNPELVRWMGNFEMVFNADFSRAEELLFRARKLAREDPNVRMNLARCLLIQEKFDQGWEEYDSRRRDPTRMHVYSKFPYQQWAGEDLAGKALAVNGEQGLGDEIMFASCLPEVATRARRCILYCNRRLAALFRRSFPDVEVVGGSHIDVEDPFPVLEGIDYQVASGSLPRVFRRAAADFPPHRGFLKASGERVQFWRDRLASLDGGFKVGLSWKGGTPLSDATRRTLTLEQLEPLLSVPGVRWINLQYGDTAGEREALRARTGKELAHWQEAVDDLDETAALISSLDLRISVCNTQIHLSGALGKEVWVLAPLSPDWRYGFRGETMRWYPAARMFRQTVIGDWGKPLEAVRRALAERVAKG